MKNLNLFLVAFLAFSTVNAEEAAPKPKVEEAAPKLTKEEFEAKKAELTTKSEASATAATTATELATAAKTAADKATADKAENAVELTTTATELATAATTANELAKTDKEALDKFVSDNTSMMSKLFAAVCVPVVLFDGVFTTANKSVKENVLQPSVNAVNGAYSSVTSLLMDHSVTLTVATALVAGSVYAYTQLDKTADKKSKN